MKTKCFSKTSTSLLAAVVTAGLTLTACPKDEAEQEPATPVGAKADAKREIEKAEVAVEGAKEGTKLGPFPIQARSDSKVTGEVTLEQVDEGVRVMVSVKNAPPGEHGTHIHQTADCSAPDAKSAGDHFAPEKDPHGLPAEDEHHLGDLGNLEVGEDGSGKLEMVVKNATLEPNADHTFIGRALIFHAKKDDGSQPSGNAGDRLGCAELKTDAG